MAALVDLDANHYQKNSTVQFRLAEDLLENHPFRGDELVLDIGCGDGKVTAKLAEKVPRGKVVGMDPSASMIELAKRSYPAELLPNLSFSLGCAEQEHGHQAYDLITAFSSLHWVRDQRKAFVSLANALKRGGSLLVLTFPAESPYWRLIESVVLQERWLPYADSAVCSHWLSSEEYVILLEEVGLDPQLLQTSRESASYEGTSQFIDYIKGWLPCLITLPEEKEAEFLSDLVDEARARYGTLQEERFAIPYDKIVIHAKK